VTAVFSVRGLTKQFAGKRVVDGLDFDVRAGEIVALVGENGAGKSTTKNMLCGLLEPSAGQVLVDGVAVQRIQPQAHGVAAVHQELSLFPSLSVTENLCIQALPGHAARIDWAAAERTACEQLEFLGIEIDPFAIVESLGAGQQQIVEIAKALLSADRLLILDEPTTSLTAPEREKLFEIMQRLKARGVAMIFISHFMDEIYRVSDSFVCLRDGHQVGTGSLAGVARGELEHLMVGRSIDETHRELAAPTDDEAIRLDSLDSDDFAQVSLRVARGEILGIAGLMGAGRTELAEAIFGLRPCRGTVSVGGEPVVPLNVATMMSRGVCYLPEDRRTHGLFLNRPVRENLSAAGILRFVRRWLPGFGFRGERVEALRIVERLAISVPHVESRVADLSGGNQQKVLLGRWLATEPRACLLDEPTKGVDIGAKFDIHTRIVELARAGTAVIVVSSDLPELLGIAHRIAVMRKGRIVGEFARADFDSVNIISLATGAAP